MLGETGRARRAAFGVGLALRRIGLLLFGLTCGNCLFEIFQS